MFRKYSKDLPEIQTEWLRMEYLLAGAAALAAVVLPVFHYQAYGAWVIVVIFLSIAFGASTKSERYATLTVELRTMPERLTSILNRWRANHGTLEQLVEQIESAVIAEGEAWVAALDDDFRENTAATLPENQSPELALRSPASRAGG